MAAKPKERKLDLNANASVWFGIVFALIAVAYMLAFFMLIAWLFTTQV